VSTNYRIIHHVHQINNYLKRKGGMYEKRIDVLINQNYHALTFQ